MPSPSPFEGSVSSGVKCYEHRQHGFLVIAERIEARVTVQDNLGGLSIFTPGDYFTITPGEAGPIFGFLHRDEFDRAYQHTERRFDIWQPLEDATTLDGRNLRSIEL